jgi:hypothetical protein
MSHKRFPIYRPRHPLYLWVGSGLLSLGIVIGTGPRSGHALTAQNPPPNMQLLNAAHSIPADSDVITSDTISQSSLTVPSLWWAREQFGHRLVENWIAYPISDEFSPRVDLVVNRQVWSLLSYLERYQFMHRFGASAREFGYSTRVFNRQGEVLAAYMCTFSDPEVAATSAYESDTTALNLDEVDDGSDANQGGTGGSSTDQAETKADAQPKALQPTCRVELDSSGAGAFRSRTSPFEGF